MKAILETQTFLLWNMDDSQLPTAARDFITGGETFCK